MIQKPELADTDKIWFIWWENKKEKDEKYHMEILALIKKVIFR